MQSSCLIRIKNQFYKMKNTLKMDGGDGQKIASMYLKPQNCQLTSSEHSNSSALLQFWYVSFNHNKSRF